MTVPTDTPPAVPTPLESAVAEYEAAAKALRDRLGVPPPLPADPSNPTPAEVGALMGWATEQCNEGRRMGFAANRVLRYAHPARYW